LTDYSGSKTLERSYLLEINGNALQMLQHMLLRLAVGIHKDKIDSVLKIIPFDVLPLVHSCHPLGLDIGHIGLVNRITDYRQISYQLTDS
jgi:hypothetical protein